MREWDSGKKLENRVKEILLKNGFYFKEEPLLTRFSLRADFLVVNDGKNFIIEVSQRNSNEDIQRICFRSLIYRRYSGEKTKTIIIIPSFRKSPQSLRLYRFLIEFSDYFLFVEELKLLPDLIKNENTVFFNYFKSKLHQIYPEAAQILDYLRNQARGMASLSEISKNCNLSKGRIKAITSTLSSNLQSLGLISKSGEYFLLNDKFKPSEL